GHPIPDPVLLTIPPIRISTYTATNEVILSILNGLFRFCFILCGGSFRLSLLQSNHFILMRQIRLWSIRIRYMLWNKIFFCTRFAVIIRPPVYLRNITWPVAMLRKSGGSPFQGVRPPRIERRQPSEEYTTEEVESKNCLSGKGNDGCNTDECIQIPKGVERIIVGERIISPGESVNTDIVHGEEYQIHSGKGQPEVDVRSEERR